MAPPQNVHHKRRNLNSGQWAIIANEAEDIVSAISEQVEQERREKISEARKAETGQKIVQSAHANDTATKLAEVFPTNRTYINQGRNRCDTAPAVKASGTSHQALRSIQRVATSGNEGERPSLSGARGSGIGGSMVTVSPPGAALFFCAALPF